MFTASAYDDLAAAIGDVSLGVLPMITPSTLKGLLYQRINQGTIDEEIFLVDPGMGLGDRAKAAAVNKMTHPPFWVRPPENDPYRTSNFLFQGEDGSLWDFKVGWEEWRKR